MRLFIKILLFVFVALITNVKVISAATTFIDIQKVTTSFSILDETPEIDFKVIENDLANCCQNGQDLVDYRNWVTSIETVAAKGGTSVIKGFTKHSANQAVGRGFKTPDILKIVREGTPVEAMGRYGAQTRYTLGGNTVVVNAQGKVVTVFSNAPGTAKGLGKGHFIPFD